MYNINIVEGIGRGVKILYIYINKIKEGGRHSILWVCILVVVVAEII